jgi:hypothetical protein
MCLFAVSLSVACSSRQPQCDHKKCRYKIEGEENKQVGAPTVPSAVVLESVLFWVKSCQIMLVMSNHVIHVKSCYSCQIALFVSNHVIHFKSCYSCQIILFMSNQVIQVTIHVIHITIHVIHIIIHVHIGHQMCYRRHFQ